MLRGVLKSRISGLLEIILLLIIFIAILLQGAVADIYWYPVGLLIIITFGISLFSWEQGWIGPPRIIGLETYVLAWIAIMVLSGLVSAHRWITVFALERFLVSLLFFYLVLWHFQSKTREKILLWALFLFPVLISILSLIFYFARKGKFWIFPDQTKCVCGTLISHNNFAGLIILCFFLGVGLMMSLRRKSREFKSEEIAKRALLALPLLILLLALAFSLSRGGWVSFALTSFSFIIWLAKASRRKKFKTYGMMILGIVLLGIILSLILERKALQNRARTLNEFLADPKSGLTITGRTMLWQSTLNMIKDHPGMGIGTGAFWAEYPQYRIPGELHGESHSHNDLLQLTAESGIPASLIFLVLLFKALRIWLNNYREQMGRFARRVSVGIIFGLCGFFFQDQFDFHFHIPGLVYYFLALSAFLLKPGAKDQSE